MNVKTAHENTTYLLCGSVKCLLCEAKAPGNTRTCLAVFKDETDFVMLGDRLRLNSEQGMSCLCLR